ncbi:MAG: hypothetical protein ACRERR_09240 [Moraxellaceae bacterium]
MLKSLPALLMASLLGLSTLALAEEIPGAKWYRYYDENNRPNVTDSLSSEHIARGYDALSGSMQVIKHVPAQRALTPQEIAAAKAKREAELQQAKDDKQLLRLYSSPADAEHARDRQIDALQLRIDFSTNSLSGLRQRRAAEAQKAATFERTGKPVPTDLKNSIANYDKQIQGAQTEITQRKAEQDKVRSDFDPVIQRLVTLTGKPASNTVPITSTPAAGGKPPAKPL